jgi:hypothetical protein
LYGIVIYIDKIFTPFSCESNIFTNISSYYYSNNVAGNEFAYGCIYINLSSSSSAVSLSSCTFMNCSVYSFSTPSSSFSAFCGGAAVSFYKNINFNFSSCFFSSCYSFHVGGAVFTNPTSALSNVYMRFDHCNFKNNHADYEGMYGGGYNIFILIDNNAGWNNFIESGDSNSNFIYNNSCSDNDAATSDDSAIVFYVVSNSSYIKGDLYFGFDACLLSIFYVSSRGSDESDCGNDDNSPCKTISYISDVSFGDIYIEVMESSNIKDFGVEISRGRTFTIVGETSAFISFFPASIDDSSTIYCFFVNFGTLAISFLTFNHSNADILSVTDSYFIVTSGELKLMDCYLKFIPSINPVLIKVLFTPFVISSSSNIILERVSMDLNYSSNSSVSIFNVSSGSFSSSGGSYKNIILNGSANCLFFGYDISSLNITNSSFSSIQRIISSSSSNYEALGGSVFSFGLNQKCTAYVGENSTFTNCSIVSLLLFNYISNDEQSLVGGGCIYMTLFSSTSLTISNVLLLLII